MFGYKNNQIYGHDIRYESSVEPLDEDRASWFRLGLEPAFHRIFLVRHWLVIEPSYVDIWTQFKVEMFLVRTEETASIELVDIYVTVFQGSMECNVK